MLIPDAEARESLIPEIEALLSDEPARRKMSEAIRTLARERSDELIVDEVVKILESES